MPSLLDLPPELRLMIYDHMIDDRGGDDPERTRSLFREREQWSTYYRKGNDSGYKYVSYVKSGLNNLVHVRPPSSQRSLWARCESPRPWSCCVVFENTELAIICATCQFLGREAMPILQKHARITITGPYLLDGMSNWHIRAMETTFPLPPRNVYFRHLIIFDSENHETVSPRLSLREVDLFRRSLQARLPELDSLTLLIPTEVGELDASEKALAPLVRLPLRVMINLFPSAEGKDEEDYVDCLQCSLEENRGLKRGRQQCRESIERCDVLAWSLKRTLRLRA